MPQTFAIISRLGSDFTSENEVIYLGEWCIAPNKKLSSGQFPNVVDYHWNDRINAQADYEFSWKAYFSVLERLVPVLNKIHQTNHSRDFWELVLGTWLLNWIGVVLDRLRSLERLNQYSSDITILRFAKESDRAPYSEEDYFQKLNKDENWNENLISDISLYFEDLHLLAHQTQEDQVESKEFQAPRSVGKFRIALKGFNFFHCVTNFKFAEYYFEKSYLRKWPLVLINLRLGQIPTFVQSKEMRFTTVDATLRAFEFDEAGENKLVKIILDLLPRYIPTPFLEGFSTLDQITETNKRPVNPKVIFTANAFSVDTEWKLWAAKKRVTGSTLVISQHGGHYGVNKYSACERLERRISDYYFTWGWNRVRDRSVIPAPATKLMGIRTRSHSNNHSSILLVSGAAHPRTNWIASMPLGPQVSESVEMSIEFVENLDVNIATNLKVRYYPQEYGINEKERWLARMPEVKFSEPEDNFESEIQKARLVVINYNATALLEAINRNIPTVMYWNFNNWELSPEAESDFREMVRMNVLFSSSELCALHVNSIWPQLESWWKQPERVAVLDNFRKKYAYIGTEPYKEFANLIKKCSRI